MAGYLSRDEFEKKLDSDPKFKADVSQKLQGVLKEFGLHDQDINNLARGTEGEQVETVFVSRSDSKRNSKSIIIF